MPEPIAFSPQHRRVLLVAAAPAEAAAVAAAFGHAGPPSDWQRVEVASDWSLVRTGVGKVNAGACVARCLGADAEPGTLVVNLGVCGALPRVGDGRMGGQAMLSNGTILLGAASVYADEGVLSPTGFTDMGAMGFAYWPGDGAKGSSPGGCAQIVPDGAMVERVRVSLAAAFGTGVVVGRIATVSTCSGTDALADEIARRTGAQAEAMEGAAIGHTLARLRGGPQGFLEIRVVSNTTGDRHAQVWDLKGAVATLTRLTAALHAAGKARP